jgi:phosphoribosylaminoimidazole (AIR) synthetase
MGLTIIVSEKDVDETMKILKKYSKSEVKIIGRIEQGAGAEFKPLDLRF